MSGTHLPSRIVKVRHTTRSKKGPSQILADVHQGIYAIFQKNLTTGQTMTLVDASPGGASRPELSRDGRTLAFVQRVRDKEALVLKSVQCRHHIQDTHIHF